MRLRSVSIPLLLLGGLALTVNTVGLTVRTHLHVHVHGCDDHEGHEGHRSHQDDHDDDSCGICQQLVKLSSQVPVFDIPVFSLRFPRIPDRGRDPEIVSSLPALTRSFPRAPPATAIVFR
jgi:hypothetical protein